MKAKKLLIFVPLLLLPLLTLLMHKTEPKHYKHYNIYVVYSPYCPHCHNLLKTLDELGIKAITIDYREFPKTPYYKFVAKYFNGVPLVFAKTKNQLIIISGYPSEIQDNNGYYYGKEYEIELCKKLGGKPVYINNSYYFCEINNTILGNRKAIEWLINICKSQGCENLTIIK
ncbi:NEQ029 [Nanoarchaeum equitans Kin4-M]|uniref:NEQ029 n=1 Tax=Nanoarchaeum equitans (strain Kin4-M) TaxID=228908 RepID=Q74MG6_NANEQ|nr:NEQ029 [Nanoarchaeum equitans Kin4-M]